MRRLARSLIRASGFVRKEIFEIVRQPRLLLTLVLGPFLILALFGVGFRNEARALRVQFVANRDNGMWDEVQIQASSLGSQLIYAGITADKEAALRDLAQGTVDVVAVVPEDAYERVQNNEPAMFTLYHREMDPAQASYVGYIGRVYTDEINRRVLVAIMQRGQGDAERIKQDLVAARENAAAMRRALEAGDQAAAQNSRRGLSRNVDFLALVLGTPLAMLGGVQEVAGSSDENAPSNLLPALSGLQQNTEDLGADEDAPASELLEKVARIEEDLAELEANLEEFTSVQPEILVQPFLSETQNVSTIQPTVSDYYAPAVIALLLQHLAVSFGALSIVRELTLGAMELFRVSPLSALETLLGKYVSYLLFSALLTAVLIGLLYFGLKVPMMGTWLNFAVASLMIIFTSLGIGFVLSLLAKTESQAVQYSMIVLLASVFFTGFMLSLDAIWQPVHVISWMLPTTYGVVMLRDIMLRGAGLNPVLLGGLAGIGVFLFVVAWLLLRRTIQAV